MANRERWRVIDTSPGRKKLYEYYASGRGRFPLDMLRYDSCWPADGDAVIQLEDGYDPRVIRSVRLRSYSEPTLDRWASFVWSIGTEKFNSNCERTQDD